jgi:hypothetical protein
MDNIKFRCCFCNRGIESSKVDPADINILINIDKPADQRYSQDFYCHVMCIREKLHEDFKMHFHLHNILDDSLD